MLPFSSEALHHLYPQAGFDPLSPVTLLMNQTLNHQTTMAGCFCHHHDHFWEHSGSTRNTVWEPLVNLIIQKLCEKIGLATLLWLDDNLQQMVSNYPFIMNHTVDRLKYKSMFGTSL